MRFICKQNIVLILFVFIINGLSVYCQNDFLFSYEYNVDFTDPIYSKILIRDPKGIIYQLYADKANKYGFVRKKFFAEVGVYSLTVSFNSDKYGKDSINYEFEINGNEINVDISVDFDYSERQIKENNIWKNGGKVPQGYIRINKYYEAPKSIEISLNKEKESTEYYKSPFFNIKNNSLDTIYGEHLPGYFWGKLFFIKPDSTYKEIGRTIDYEFADSPPLFPDSVKIATVGSFGLYKYLPPAKYKYEVLFMFKKWVSTGIGIFLDNSDFVWWAGTKEYNKLKCDFEIK